ncbi:MAG: alpha/beta hydrolase [Candidatus Sungbacteria bacterium]|nr:alpha/beta hydrolase [Candidatus Sungbacteria bacterium]
MLKKLGHWLVDYTYLFRGAMHSVWRHAPPEHYLGFVVPQKSPVVLLPGIGATWHFMRSVGDRLSHEGHPVYVIQELRFTTGEVGELASITRRFIETEDLTDLVLVGYSKGGLIGKYILAFLNADRRVKKLVAIATPFQGSRAAGAIPQKNLKELHPESSVIRQLSEERTANARIVSIYGEWDNHIWPTENARLEGAKNIQVPVRGHHKILFDKAVLDILTKEVDS